MVKQYAQYQITCRICEGNDFFKLLRDISLAVDEVVAYDITTRMVIFNVEGKVAKNLKNSKSVKLVAKVPLNRQFRIIKGGKDDIHVQ